MPTGRRSSPPPPFASMSFTIAGRGWHSLAVDIGGHFIAKFPEGEEAEEALRREAPLLAAVRPRLSMAVPDMTIHEGPPLFSLHPKLPGATLERDGYRRLDDDARRRLADDIALFLAELHAIDPQIMRTAGALPVGWWDTGDGNARASLAAVAGASWQAGAQRDRRLPGFRHDPLGEVYGFFDAHGWNMAFDHREGRLKGIFDFADLGFGPPHREFVQYRSSIRSLLHAPPALTRR